MKVKELLPIIKVLMNADKGEYFIEYSLKDATCYCHRCSTINDTIRNFKYYKYDKMVMLSNDDENVTYLRTLYDALSSPDVDKDSDVVFGHYISTGKSSKTLITVDEYNLALASIDGNYSTIKFDIHYDYLNI